MPVRVHGLLECVTASIAIVLFAMVHHAVAIAVIAANLAARQRLWWSAPRLVALWQARHRRKPVAAVKSVSAPIAMGMPARAIRANAWAVLAPSSVRCVVSKKF